ncbi:MAG: ComEC/Rec2 family competence protein [Candidatus Liberibacter asiaticus]|nr:ComEC/Rec2 family competence protein [Candidatus Liberibacter asiaticus]
MLSITKKYDPFPAETTIEGIARLSPPSGPAFPGLFDFNFSSYYKGISAIGYFYSIPKMIYSSESHNTWTWKKISSIKQSFLNEIRANIGTYGSASASIFLIKHFHCIPVYGLIANILAIPILSFVVIPAGLIAILLMILSLDNIPFGVMAWGLDIIIHIAHRISVAHNEFCIGRIPETSFVTIVVEFLLMVFCKTNIRHIGSIMIGITIIILCTFPYSFSPDLLISEKGNLVALVDKNTLISNYSNPPSFIFSQWKSALITPFHEAPHVQKEDLQEKNQSSLKEILRSMQPRKFLCIKKSFCVGCHRSDVIVGVLKRKDMIRLSCQLSDILITTIRDINTKLCNVSLLITPEILQKQGSLEITIIPPSNDNDKVKFIIKSAIENLHFPWTKHRI